MTTKLFKKLNFKSQSNIVAVNYPDSFKKELSSMKDFAEIVLNPDDIEQIDFAIAFGKTQKEVNDITNQLGPKLADDAIYWFCYPKKSSKRYTCEFNRDTGWEVMANYNLEPVRQVAIDEDWSALRFRNVDKIKTITRRKSMALTDKAKKRTSQQDDEK